MPASYPGSIKTFTVKIDGVDYVMAAHVNDIQDEITAIETALRNGPLGIGVAAPTAQLSVFGGVAPSGTGLGIKLLSQQGGAGGDGGTVLIGAGENGAGGGNGEIQFGTASPTIQGLSLTFAKFAANGDFYSVPLTDYSSTSTIVGWSSFTVQQIFYKRIGKLVYVIFNVIGVSNSINTSFSLPYSSLAGGPLVTFPIRSADNGLDDTTSMGYLTNGNNIIVFYRNLSGAGWTASGAKDIRGQFFYEMA